MTREQKLHRSAVRMSLNDWENLAEYATQLAETYEAHEDSEVRRLRAIGAPNITSETFQLNMLVKLQGLRSLIGLMPERPLNTEAGRRRWEMLEAVRDLEQANRHLRPIDFQPREDAG